MHYGVLLKMSLDYSQAIENAISNNSNGFVGLDSADEFNDAIENIAKLLHSSSSLLNSGDHATSIFLSITAFEEIVKVRIGMHRFNNQKQDPVKRSKDPLFNHGKKHYLSLDRVLLIGDKLKDAIGEERVEYIFNNHQELINLRESSLYFSRDEKGLNIPNIVISPIIACELLLISIEMHSDAFWGLTTKSKAICNSVDALFSSIEVKLSEENNSCHTTSYKAQ